MLNVRANEVIVIIHDISFIFQPSLDLCFPSPESTVFCISKKKCRSFKCVPKFAIVMIII